MPVTVFVKATGDRFRGKFAYIEAARVHLFPEIVAEGRGGFAGVGSTQVFAADEVDVLAHDWDTEVRQG